MVLVFLAVNLITATDCIAQEQKSLDGLISQYTESKTDTARIRILAEIIKDAPNGVWEKYNTLLMETSKRCLVSNDKVTVYKGKESLSAALNNEGYIKDLNGDFDKAMDLYNESLKIKMEIGDYSGQAVTLNNIADIFQKQGKVELAEDFFNRSLEIRKRINEKTGIAESYNNLGFLYEQMGRFQQAIGFHFKSLKISQEIKDIEGTGRSYINIGIVHSKSLNEYNKSIKYYRNCLKVLGNDHKYLESYALDNIGVAYKGIYSSIENHDKEFEKREYFLDSAILYFNKSLLIRKNIDDKRGIGYTLNNIGEIFFQKNQFLKAEEYFLEALKIRYVLNDKKDIAYSLATLSSLYFITGQLDKAKKMAMDGYSLSKEIGFPENIKKSSLALFDIYKSEKNYKDALDKYTEYIKMRDSLQNQESRKQLFKQQFQIEYDIKVRSDSLLAVEEKKVIDAKFRQERTQRYALYGGLFVLMVFGGVTFNRFYVTRKQKTIIQKQELKTNRQKNLLSQKNAEILSSIEYAKRIQSTILPSRQQMANKFHESFIIYLPKDIVAGDFYWVDSNQNPINDSALIAVCDSTGHGVPGALVSLVCSKALERAHGEFNLTDTGLILDKVAEIVVTDFSKNSDSDDIIMDGMDASLCRIDYKNEMIEWSGANNPLWVVYPNGDFLELKPDKLPIGRTENRAPYLTNRLTIVKGMVLYMFTDGFSDQFGGPYNKKYQRKKFKELIKSLPSFSMIEQGKIIHNEFELWKGDQEQIDDVCVIGIRL
jgi:tetratricopeptide (TPR) repeat protein